MKHRALPRFWEHYPLLPKEVRELADKNFDLLKSDPHHPSLHFKKVDDDRKYGRYVLVCNIVRWAWKNQMAFCGFGLVLTLITTSCCRELKQIRPYDYNRGDFLSEKYSE